MDKNYYDKLCSKYFNEPWTISILMMKKINNSFVFTIVEKELNLLKISSKIYTYSGCHYVLMTSQINIENG